MEERVNPLQLLMEEFESEESRVRVNAMRRLPIIAAVLGESSQAKGQLLGFLENVLNSEEEDEVLFGMGESLLSLSRYFKLKMIFIIEKLVCVEERVVREKAVECYISLVKYLKKSEIREVLIPNVKKLAESSEFTTKMSAIDIMTEIYPACSEEDKKIIRNKLNQLFGEESLMVRRVLASKMGTLCNYMSKSTVLSELINSFKTLTNDDSANVRILTISSLVDLAKNLNDEENKAYMIPIIINLTSDKSWRVKFHLAGHFASIAKAVGREVTDSLIPIFSSLLRDPEGEVRISAVKALRDFIHLLKLDRVKSVLAYLQTLAKDTVSLVRVGVCQVLHKILAMKLPPLKPSSKDSLAGRIHTILLEGVMDPDLEVKLEAMDILKQWGILIQFSDIHKVLKQVQTYLNPTTNWRLRGKVLDALLTIACAKKDPALFSKHFKHVFTLGLKDPAFRVRETTLEFIPRFSLFLTDNYILTYLAVEILHILDDPNTFNYMLRVSSLYALAYFHQASKDKKSIADLILKQVLPLLHTPLVNIRQVTVKVLNTVLLTTTNNDFLNQVPNKLKQLATTETDPEILFLLQHKHTIKYN